MLKIWLPSKHILYFPLIFIFGIIDHTEYAKDRYLPFAASRGPEKTTQASCTSLSYQCNFLTCSPLQHMHNKNYSTKGCPCPFWDIHAHVQSEKLISKLTHKISGWMVPCITSPLIVFLRWAPMETWIIRNQLNIINMIILNLWKERQVFQDLWSSYNYFCCPKECQVTEQMPQIYIQ